MKILNNFRSGTNFFVECFRDPGMRFVRCIPFFPCIFMVDEMVGATSVSSDVQALL